MLQGQKVDIKTGGDFEPVPMDRYTVLIVDVNLVSQNKFQSTELEDVLNYQFAILDDKPMPKEGDSDEEKTTRGRFLWKRCRTALNNRSWLGKLAKAAIGRDLTKEEAEEFDAESIVGAQVDVMVEQAESKDKQRIFNNIVAFNKTVKKLEPVEFQPKEQGVVEKTTVPAEAPKTKDEVDNFADKLEEERKDNGDEGSEAVEASDKTPEELEAEAAEAEAKAARAKVNAVKAMAKAKKS